MRDPREISRNAAAAMGAEAVRICEEGRYVAPSGRMVEIGSMVAEAIAGTIAVPPSVQLDTWPSGQRETQIEVREESTLAAALTGAFRGVFERVVFAVLDTSRERRTIGPFERRFG
ncbi:MAG TPA: poly(ADP-ribose) glycohydrolase domain-containing protein [Nannocystis sp.]